MQYVLAKGSIQPVVIARSVTGLATAFHATKTVWAPEIYKYTAGPWTVKEQRGVKNWTLVYLDDAAVVDSAANSDNDIKFLNENNLASPLTGQRLTAVNNMLANSDMALTITSGTTVKAALNQILTALGQSADALIP